MKNRFLQRIAQIFHFSPAEARGFTVVLVFLIALLAAWIGEEWYFSQSPAFTIPEQKLDSLVVLLDKKEPKQRENDTFQASNITHLSPFDPNTASVAALQDVGIPRFLAERIEKYRSKGGKFRKKEDLQRIYDFPAKLYNQLESYIQLPKSNEQVSNGYDNKAESYHTQFENNPKFPVSNNQFPTSKPTQFDINTADTTVLKRINGIGSGYAKRIIKFREALGGFISTDQVRETFGLPPETADELLKFAVLKSPAHKININEATIETLDAHPYINKLQAKIIVAYREQHGAFKTIEDLQPIKVLDGATIEKIKPYLVF
jgi:competence ComEA-like helix-hairpin-helix protein